VDKLVTFDFVDESTSKVTLPDEIKEAVKNCLLGKGNCNEEFVEVVETWREFWGSGPVNKSIQAPNKQVTSLVDGIISGKQSKTIVAKPAKEEQKEEQDTKNSKPAKVYQAKSPST